MGCCESREYPQVPPCSCTATGWCERHLRYKNDHQFRLCQDRNDYRALWDELAQTPERQARAPAWKQYFDSTRKWTRAGCPTRSQDVVQGILIEHCEKCEYYGAGKLGIYCEHCGCFLVAKIERATEECPIGKW